MGALILASNPGSASRKYALYEGLNCLAKIHFEHVEKDIVYSYSLRDKSGQEKSNLSHLTFAGSRVVPILQKHGVLNNDTGLAAIALRVVAPSSYFQKHRLMNDEAT